MADSGDLILVGLLLVMIVPLLVIESAGYIRAGIGKAFWEQPLDDKLDHVVAYQTQWWLIGITWVGLLAVVTAGLAGLTYLLVDAGEGTVAAVSLGAFVLAAVAWLGGVTAQTAGAAVAAQQRRDSGATPSWIHPLWQSAYLTEGTWVILANLTYIGFGAAILKSDVVGAWAGWVAMAVGVLIPLAVLITRNGFPQLPLLVPLVLGIALLIEGF